MDEQVYLVRANTQLPIGNLRIGVGNIRETKYLDEQGVAKQGLTAGLWIYSRNDPEQKQQARVYAGQKIIVGNYLIRVIDISKSGAHVQLAITLPGDSRP